MKVHELKTHAPSFSQILIGTKRAEFRWNDRDFKVGDLLLLREQLVIDATNMGDKRRKLVGHLLTDRSMVVRVTHIQEDYGIPEGFVMMSIELIGETEPSMNSLIKEVMK